MEYVLLPRGDKGCWVRICCRVHGLLMILIRNLRIFWAISRLCWAPGAPSPDAQASHVFRLCALVLTTFKMRPGLCEIEGGQWAAASIWQLIPSVTSSRSGQNDATQGPSKIPQGVYALQNKASLTYASLSPDERTLGCWPCGSQLNEPKMVSVPQTLVVLYSWSRQWEIAPLGAGYTIRLHNTDKYCTLKEGISGGCSISFSTIPAAWRIDVLDSPLNSDGMYIQYACRPYRRILVVDRYSRRVFWADTEMTWDLNGYGKPTPGNPVRVTSWASGRAA